MWKRILAWQQRSQRTPSTLNHALREVKATLDAARPDRLMPAFIIAQKNGVAVEREFAKMMW